MPIDKLLLRCCPLLTETDTLLLSAHFMVKGRELYDTTVQASHGLQPHATNILKVLKGGITYGDLLKLGEQLRIDHSALQELLGFLNTIGALQRKRNWQGAVQAFRMYCTHALIGIVHTGLSYRTKANTKGLAIGILRAITPVILATGVVAGLAGAAGLAPPALIGIQALSWISLLYSSILIHELGHVLVLKRYGVTTHILQRGFRLGLIHTRSNPITEIHSLIAGPLCGILLCGSAVIAGLHGDVLPLTWAGIAGMACHMLSLLPLYGDGQSLQKALQKRNSP